VITLDLPGHGALAHVPFTEENVSALMRDAVENVVGSAPLIVGYSLGGFVAMRYAAHAGDRTRGLLLAGCTLDFEGWEWWPYGVSVRLTETLPDAWLSAMMHATLTLTLPRRWVDVVEGIPFNRGVFSQTSTIVRESNRAIEEIAGYSKPVLFVNGEFDFVFRSDERRFLHRLPQARLRIIRGVDHTAPMRRAEEFSAVVDEFARKVFATAPPTV